MLYEFHFASGTIAYEVKGAGPLLVLLHGYGGNHNDWKDSSNLLEKNYTVILPRLVHLFFPKKGKHSFSIQVDILASFLSEVRERFRNEKVTMQDLGVHVDRRFQRRLGVNLAGTSFGGALAWAIAVRFPRLVEKLVLVTPMPSNPAARLSDPSLKMFLALARVPLFLQTAIRSPLGQVMLRRIETLFHAPWAERGVRTRLARITDRKLKLILLMFYQFAWISAHEDWNEWELKFGDLKAATLFIFGTNDSLFKKSDLDWFSRQFAKSETVHILRGGHLVMREFPADVVRAMGGFLDSSKNARNGSSSTIDPSRDWENVGLSVGDGDQNDQVLRNRKA